jgi:hypothetical protein
MYNIFSFMSARLEIEPACRVTLAPEGFGSGLGFVDPLTEADGCGAGGQGAGTTDHEQVPTTDVAAYLADMLLELRTIAQQSGFATLSRVLVIAEEEAKLRTVKKAG